jgi:hypothetical protein
MGPLNPSDIDGALGERLGPPVARVMDPLDTPRRPQVETRVRGCVYQISDERKDANRPVRAVGVTDGLTITIQGL